LALRVLGRNHVHIASIKKRWLTCAAAIISSTCRALIASAFSHNTCLPAFRHKIVSAWWLGCGVAMIAASRSGSLAKAAFEA